MGSEAQGGAVYRAGRVRGALRVVKAGGLAREPGQHSDAAGPAAGAVARARQPDLRGRIRAGAGHDPWDAGLRARLVRLALPAGDRARPDVAAASEQEAAGAVRELAASEIRPAAGDAGSRAAGQPDAAITGAAGDPDADADGERMARDEPGSHGGGSGAVSGAGAEGADLEPGCVAAAHAAADERGVLRGHAAVRGALRGPIAARPAGI